MGDPFTILEYAFNPAKMFNSLYIKNGDNYRVHKAIATSRLPLYSQMSGAIVAKMEDEEQLRWVSDFAKNTGIDPSNWKYPIRMGYYGNPSAYGNVMANTNRGIMNLYKRVSYKPKEVNIYNNKRISNYGDYHRYGDFNYYNR